MYKVLIVDDEPIICEGLRKSVKWDHYNCEVAGTASNGLEGLEQMKALHPDILITDISMNNMDGLAMVAAIRSEFPDAEVCLLTGYRNFEYAQRAIQLGVTRFLLKPSKMEEIDEAITAMTETLRRKGNLGEAVVDNLWDLRSSQESYIYETFMKDRQKNKDPEDGRIRDSEANSYVLKSALVFMTENYTRKLSLGDVAQHCYVSSWHLSKLLNQYTGRGFFEILNRIRLDRAKELLTDSGRKIQDISEEVGFQDVAHFSRIFKSNVGCSPKEYRSSADVRNLHA